MQTKRLSALTLLFYGGPAIPISMLTMPLVLYLPPFYAAEIGLSLAAVGAIFFLARAWDGFIDPIIGILSDRTRSRFGRRKPWIAIGTPFLLIATWFLCQPGPDIDRTYLLIWVFSFYLAWTMVQIPFLSWGAELSNDYRERSRIVGFREGNFMLGVLLTVSLPLLFLSGHEPSLREILYVLVIAISIILPVSVLLALIFVPESNENMEQPVTFRAMGKILKQNKPFQRLMVITFSVWLGIHVYNAALLMVLQHAFHFPGSMFLKLVMLQFVIGTLTTPLIVRVANRIGKHRALGLGVLGTALVLPAMMFVTPGETWQIALIFFALGFTISPIWILPTALIADTADYGTLRGGGRQEGLYMALYNLAVKIALAASVGIALPLLDVLGFNPTGHNGPQEIASLLAVGLGLPVIIMLPGLALLWNYPIDRRRHDIIRRRIFKLHGA